MEASKKSKEDDCGGMITSSKDGKDVKMEDDIKNIIIERLKYCQRIQDLEKDEKIY